MSTRIGTCPERTHKTTHECILIAMIDFNIERFGIPTNITDRLIRPTRNTDGSSVLSQTRHKDTERTSGTRVTLEIYVGK